MEYGALAQTTESKISKFFRELPVRIGIVLISLVGKLPYSAITFLGKTIGLLMFYLARSRRRIASQNFRLCYPELSKRERKLLLRENLKSTGIGIIETAFAWHATPSKIKAVSEVIGLEYLREMQAKGQGAIVLGFHTTSLELAGQALSGRIPLSAMYRQHRNPIFDDAMLKGRSKELEEMIEREDVRPMIKCLKAGKSVWYAADQDYGPLHSIFAPFFNIQAASITATSRFVRFAKVPVFPTTHHRDKDTGKIIIEIHPALKGFGQTDDYTDACITNKFLEKFLQQHPEDYLWVHRRFKTRPPGMPKLYDPKSLFKRKTMREYRFNKVMAESKLLEGTKQKPELVLMNTGDYLKFIYRSHLFQSSPARLYTKNWQQEVDSKQQILELYRYYPLNAEIVRYQLKSSENAVPENT